jgi:hypothetical protein
MPANTTKSESSTKSSRVAQNSPLSTLPAEVRLVIYEFALQHTVNEIKETSAPRFSSSSSEPQRSAIKGALALLHTSNLLRSESSKAFNSLVQLERFQFRRNLGWKDLANMANARVGSSEGKEIAGRNDLMRDVRGLIERVCESVKEAESE